MWQSLQRGALEVVRFFFIGLWHLGGWRLIQGLPELDKYVIIAVPHTANIDYYHMLTVMIHERRFPNVTVKDSWMKTPIIGPIMKALGGIPIDRSKSHNLSDQLAEKLRAAKRMALIFTPEGTRGRTEYWRTGFYYTAYKAGVPIACAYVDYPRKIVSIDLVLEPTGNIEADFEIIKAYYEANGVGKYPQNKSVLALKPRSEPNKSDETAEA